MNTPATIERNDLRTLLELAGTQLDDWLASIEEDADKSDTEAHATAQAAWDRAKAAWAAARPATQEAGQ